MPLAQVAGLLQDCLVGEPSGDHVQDESDSDAAIPDAGLATALWIEGHLIMHTVQRLPRSKSIRNRLSSEIERFGSYTRNSI